MLGPPDLVPLTGPLAAVETIYRVPTGRIAYAHARIIHVMSGRTHIETAHGAHIALAGDTLVIGSGAWCAIQPNPWVRSWTIYVDEALLREHMRWAVPEDAPLTQGVPRRPGTARPSACASHLRCCSGLSRSCGA